ncbi:efflux RND transporter permease subunit [Ahrensia marina]|uniref:efflux RND transporter permease subunit n=1 Tax=Ahrensia marina TaxID=1514904 RepID=UPI0035CFF6B8
MDLARFAIEKRVISGLMTLLILLGGVFAYNALPRFEDPEFIIREARIVTVYPGASADDVALEVTEKVENALQQLQGVEEIRSVTSPELSVITVEFTIASTPDYPELYQRFAQMRAKIRDIEPLLPPNVLAPQIFDDFGDVYALYFAITGEGFSRPEIHEYAKILQRDLVVIDGVSRVVLNGVPNEVIYVEYSGARLTELGITPQQIAGVLEGQNLIGPVGSVVAGPSRLSIRPDNAVDSLAAIENLVLSNPQTGRSFRLSDIAEVSRGLEEPAEELLFKDGVPAIGIGISNVLGGNVVEMGNAVRARMAELESERPLGIEILPISDQSVSVERSVNDFVMNVVVALGIVVGTLVVFMGLRSGILMGTILLVTVAGTLVGMLIYGLDMQRVSLGALIIALGMLVDNAIVVVEGTLVRMKKGQSAAAASIAVVNQTKWPLLGGTIVGFLAFSPIGLSPDNTGEYAGSMFYTIMIALLFSWVVAIWLTPYLCTLMLKSNSGDQKPKKENILLRGYHVLLDQAIRFRYLTVALVVGLFMSALAAAAYVPPGFFPDSTRAQFVIDYNLPEGTDIQRTQRDVLEIAEHVRTREGVTSTSTVLGGGHTRFQLTYEGESPNPAYGQILIDVTDAGLINGLRDELQSWLAEQYPSANAKVWKYTIGPGGGSAIQAQFLGPDANTLRSLAEQAQRIMADNGAVSVNSDWREQIQVIRPVIDTEDARRLGLSQADINQAIRAHFSGTQIGVYREAEELNSIIMRRFESERSDLSSVRSVQVFSQLTGGYVPITEVVDDFQLVFEPGNLRRVDRQLAIKAQSDPAQGVLVGELFNQIRGPIEAIELPPGYSLVWKGEFGDSEEANAGLASTFPLGFGAMVLVVVLLFNKISQPLIIWLTVPLALIGVLWGLAASQTPLEFMAILGILSLTGMLIKNAIVLIDETDLQISDGKPRLQAVKDAAVSRVRPVSLGVITTVLGVVPLLWDPFFQSLAVVIICGLSFATLLTLIVVPTLYAIFFQIKAKETEDTVSLQAPDEASAVLAS